MQTNQTAGKLSRSSATPGTPLIQVRGIKKTYRSDSSEVPALQGINFNVHEGELFGFLGPNGAGKTTTINILTGLARIDSGTIQIAGHDCTKNPKAAQHLVGIVPDESNLYPELTGRKNLIFCGALYGMAKHDRERRAQELLELFGLTGAADRLFSGYSKGMKRKLTIAAGIIHQPRILFLDEPTTGIDVASAIQIRQMVQQLHDEGTTIFLTTHYIEEAERLCERIAFIVNGRIVRDDTVHHLLEPVQHKRTLQFTLSVIPDDLIIKLEKSFPNYRFSRTSASGISVDTDTAAENHQHGDISIGPLVRFMEHEQAIVNEARIVRPSLEDVFVEVTGLQLNSMKQEKERGKGK